ncbi:MAG: Fe-S cluster domain-containing protein [Pseudomonadota bacterium]
MVIYSVLTLFGLGLLTATVLAMASRVFYVEEDPRVEAVMDVLPGANCGGCGYAGCEGYAIAVVNDPDIPANKCCAGGEGTSIAVGELTGKTVGASEPLRSFRRCDKVEGKVALRYDYQGIPSCAAAALLFEGSDACTFSCLGYGDCAEVCPFDAITMSDGLSHINWTKCTGCGICVSACPRNTLQLIPLRSRVALFCATKNKLKAVMEVCEAGCINCTKCVKKCPAKAISVKGGRIEIDQILCLSYGPDCNMACIDACSRGGLKIMAMNGKCERATDQTPPHMKKLEELKPVAQTEAKAAEVQPAEPKPAEAIPAEQSPKESSHD